MGIMCCLQMCEVFWRLAFQEKSADVAYYLAWY